MSTQGRGGRIAPGRISPEERQRMIRDAAYYHYAERGFADGHDVEDWLAAEAEVNEEYAAEESPEALAALEFEAQQSGAHSPREDDALKRIIKQHPVRDIPQVESVEPREAPLKE
jgi:hypothetical protein